MTEGGCALVLQKDLEYWTIGGYFVSVLGILWVFWVFCGYFWEFMGILWVFWVFLGFMGIYG